VTVTFDGTWSSNDAAPTRTRDATGRPTGAIQNEFWTLLYQRAYLQHRGVDWTQPDIADWGFEANNADAVRAISGWYREGIDVTADLSVLAIKNFLAHGDAMSALYNDHRFAILDTFRDTSTGKWMIKLYNPRAIDNSAWADARNDGEVVITWDTFVSNFTHISHGVANATL